MEEGVRDRCNEFSAKLGQYGQEVGECRDTSHLIRRDEQTWQCPLFTTPSAGADCKMKRAMYNRYQGKFRSVFELLSFIVKF